MDSQNDPAEGGKVRRVKELKKVQNEGKIDMQSDPVFPSDGWDYARVNTASPPCFKCLCGRQLCEYACCCRVFGKVGLEVCSQPTGRRRVMGVASALNIGAMACTLAAVCALSSSTDVLLNVAWARGTVLGVNTSQSSVYRQYSEPVDVSFHLGLNGIVRQVTSTGDGRVLYEEYDAWDDASICNSTNGTMLEHCTNCKDAATGTVSVAIMAVVTSLPTIQTSIQRMFRRYDLNCQKFLAVFVSGIFGTLSTMASLLAFRTACYSSLPDKYGSYKLEWALGASFTALVFATCFKLLDATFHLLVKTPEDLHYSKEDRIKRYRARNQENRQVQGL